MAKGRDKIKLVSSAGTGHYYTTDKNKRTQPCLLYTSPSPRDATLSRMPSSA